MNPTHILLVGLAGSLGAVVRFQVDGIIRARSKGLLPVGTMTINLSGSFLLGLLTGLVMFHGAPSTLTLVAGTGFCGGYTTFSTASFETVRLVQQRESRTAVLASAVTVLGTLATAALGLALAGT